MSLELTARTEAGERLIALADTLAQDLAIAAVRDSGYLGAPIPVGHGGLGVESVHDLVLASARLARRDASMAIGINMHLVAVQSMARRWRIAVARGSDRRATALAKAMAGIVRDRVVIAAAIDEPSQDLTLPATRATRVDAGWRIDGHRIMFAMSLAATTLSTAVSFRDDVGAERYGYALIPAGAEGVTVHDDGDAPAMRAVASHAVSFDGVVVPEAALPGGFPAGDAVGLIERNLTAGLFHASVSLGIAEGAQRHALAAARRRGGAGESLTRTLAAQSAIDLTVCRAALARGGAALDEHAAAHPDSHGSAAELTAMFGEVHAIKAFVIQAAARLVDRAVALGGGAFLANGHPIARAARDVRTGVFMDRLASDRAHDLLGRVALGAGSVRA